MKDDLQNDQTYAYDEAFIHRAVAITFARSRSIQEVAASLSIPAETLEEWRREHSEKIEVRYLEGRRVRSGGLSRPFLSKQQTKGAANKLERCPKCSADVVFEHVKGFEIQREKGVDIGTHNSIMNSGDDGIFGIKVPYVRITTELIARCPVCGLYTIRNVTEKLSHSEV